MECFQLSVPPGAPARSMQDFALLDVDVIAVSMASIIIVTQQHGENISVPPAFRFVDRCGADTQTAPRRGVVAALRGRRNFRRCQGILVIAAREDSIQ